MAERHTTKRRPTDSNGRLNSSSFQLLIYASIAHLFDGTRAARPLKNDGYRGCHDNVALRCREDGAPLGAWRPQIEEAWLARI